MSNDYFTGDRSFWDDPDFATVEDKAVYAMLWQSLTTDIAGIHIRNDKIDSDRVCIGYSEYQDTLLRLSEAGKIVIFNNKIWVKSAIWYNLNKGKFSKQQLKAVSNRIPRDCAKLIIEYYKEKYFIEIPYQYPIDTLPIGYRTETETETESDTETDTDKKIKKKKAKPRPSPKGFDDIPQSKIDEMKQDYPNLDVDREFKKCKEWWHGGKKKVKRPVVALRNWLDKAEAFRLEKIKNDSGGGADKFNPPGSQEEFENVTGWGDD